MGINAVTVERAGFLSFKILIIMFNKNVCERVNLLPWWLENMKIFSTPVIYQCNKKEKSNAKS